MIHSMFGRVVFLCPDYIGFDVNNIVYKIHIINQNRCALHEELSIYIHEQVRECETILYGFITLEEKEVFVLLLSVNGVGPKTAKTIIEQGGVEMLVSAISAQDINYFRRINGVGSKTASLILLALKDKVSKQELLPSNVFNAVLALSNLGFAAATIRNTYSTCRSIIDEDMSVSDISKLLLSKLGEQSGR